MDIRIPFLLIISYLVGSIPTAYLIGRLWAGVDIRQLGSGNVGATNVIRTIGTYPGIIVLIIDIFKGVGPVLLAHLLFKQQIIELAAGFIAIAGHTWTVFLRFKGGKGVATSLGVFIALAPWPVVIIVAVFILIVALTRYVALGSIIGAAILPFLIWVIEGNPLLTLVATIVACLILIRHLANIKRIIAGTEHKIWQKE